MKGQREWYSRALSCNSTFAQGRWAAAGRSLCPCFPFHLPACTAGFATWLRQHKVTQTPANAFGSTAVIKATVSAEVMKHQWQTRGCAGQQKKPAHLPSHRAVSLPGQPGGVCNLPIGSDDTWLSALWVLKQAWGLFLTKPCSVKRGRQASLAEPFLTGSGSTLHRPCHVSVCSPCFATQLCNLRLPKGLVILQYSQYT